MNWKLQDMENEAEEPVEAAPLRAAPKYSYGLAICLTEKELDKLGLDCDVEVGDYLHGMFFAKVTAVSTHAHEEGAGARVEMQITHLALEDESTEAGDEE